MSNALALMNSGKGLAGVDDVVRAMMNISKDLQAPGGVQFLKFSKGDWTIGRNNDSFPNNTFTAVIRVDKIAIGWQCWKDSQVIEDRFAGIFDPQVDQASLPDHGPYTQQNDGWSKAVKVAMVILPEGGVREPIIAEWSASSVGGTNAVGEFIKNFVEAYQTGQHNDDFPVVSFGGDKYKHKSFGWVKFPVLKIVRWATSDDLAKNGVPVNGGKPAAAGNSGGASAQTAAQPAYQPAPQVAQTKTVGDVDLDDL